MQDTGNHEIIKLPLKNRVNAFLWFLHRLTGIVIIVWMTMHTFTNFLILQGKEVYEQEVVLYHELVPQIDIFYAILGVVIAWHAFYGLTNIIRDLSGRSDSYNSPTRRVTKGFSSWFKNDRNLPTRPLWSIHRISALIILFTVFVHFVWIHLIGSYGYYSNWESVIETFKNPMWMLFYLLFDFGISFHGTQGIRIILTDFTGLGSRPERHKLILALSLFAGIIGFLVLAYIDVSAFLYVNSL